MADAKTCKALTTNDIISAGIPEPDAGPLLGAVLQCQANAGQSPQQVSSMKDSV